MGKEDARQAAEVESSQQFRVLLLFLGHASCSVFLVLINKTISVPLEMPGNGGELVTSLMFQDLPTPLNVQPEAVIDIQLAFPELTDRVPAHLVRGLPCKEQIDFDSFHSRNMRAMPLPLSRCHATYAMDDLHRIEAILCSQSPPGGSYNNSNNKNNINNNNNNTTTTIATTTELIVQQTRADTQGLNSLQDEMKWFAKKRGVKKVVKAVEIKRHILAIRAKEAQLGRDDFISAAEKQVDAVLRGARVVIPEDLSFSG
ncbi:unnamed protein product [Polarella glacialis]|uniref:Uncharacterized protein n=1 Tax=Polarella glacialis TaxID=89957 RepID=A0A813L3H4_POLGL|nr:unnamed protein product [Polarella glacialis]